ncbi:predicted protein [Histoplasma capsulatum var. duboisii H88]|uniref:Predicted protein n=1 Tax=Ajellomyces capsulatus (strain H88) TaxID=544711 RepID=F0U8B2_AJEC8|nr:predicted protein [Histoplasma capsulatum var. duboisii H88]
MTHGVSAAGYRGVEQHRGRWSPTLKEIPGTTTQHVITPQTRCQSSDSATVQRPGSPAQYSLAGTRSFVPVVEADEGGGGGEESPCWKIRVVVGYRTNELRCQLWFVQSNAVGRLFCFSLPRTQVKDLYGWAGQPFPRAFALELRHHRGPEQSMSPEEGREEK